jgi:hypothetical protein
MTRIKDLHKKWMKDPEYRKEFDTQEEEFALAAEVAKATGHRVRISFEPVRGTGRAR